MGNSIFNREELLGRTIDQLNIRGSLAKIWRYAKAVDDKGTPARNLVEWYRKGIFANLRNLRPAARIAIVVFLLAFIGGFIIGQSPDWQIPLAKDASMTDVAGMLGHYLSVPTQTGTLMLIVWQNGRILLAALILSLFTFGAASLVLTPAVYIILGYIFSQVFLAGYNPAFLFAAVFTHGIIEIPVIVLATAASLRLGAVVTRPPRGMTVGHAWTTTLGQTLQLALGLVIPGLILAAFIEAFITPRVVVAILGGG